MKKQRGFVGVGVLIAIMFGLVAFGGGAGWWYMNKPSVPVTSETTQLPTSQETTNAQTATKPFVPVIQTPTSNNQPVTNSKPATNEVLFTTPGGYIIEQEPSYQDAAWHEASGIDKRVSITKEQYVKDAQAKIAAGIGTGGSASIIIDLNRNPRNLTVQQWLQEKVGCSAQESTAYSFKDRTGVRCVPPSGQHLYDGIAVQHKGWIVYILNSYDTDSEVQTFDQLLASITFAK